MEIRKARISALVKRSARKIIFSGLIKKIKPFLAREEVEESGFCRVTKMPETTTERRWVSRSVSRPQVRGYLPGSMAHEVEAAKAILVNWREGFRITISRAEGFHNNMIGDHLWLNIPTREAIYPSAEFQQLRRFANAAIAGLKRQASIFRSCASGIGSTMSGRTTGACEGALERGADYFDAVAQTVEKDFGSGGIAGDVNHTTGFAKQGVTTSTALRK